MSLYVETCYRCPKRGYRFARNYCQILDAKLKAVKGIGLTRIAFKCEARESLFPPGTVVNFERIVDDYYGSHGFTSTGIVMRTKGRKVLIYSEDIERTVSWWYPDKLTDTGERVSVCANCGRPEGKEFKVKNASGDESDWECSGSVCVFQGGAA